MHVANFLMNLGPSPLLQLFKTFQDALLGQLCHLNKAGLHASFQPKKIKRLSDLNKI